MKMGLKETARALSLATDRKVAELASAVLTENRHTIRAANAAEALEQCGRPGGITGAPPCPPIAPRTSAVVHPTRPSGEPGAHLDALDALSSIGQDITASLDFGEIFVSIERHVGALLDTATLYIGILDERREWIDVPLFVDGGKRGPSRRIRLDDPLRPAARAIRENREILREKTEEQARREDMPGTALTLSALFRPLSVHGNTFGVMSVQSQHAHAYGERERLIFRTICSYAAVALANAESHRRLAAIKPLEALVAVSREITASLDRDRIFSAVERHVGELCEATTFYIGLLDESAQWLSLDFCINGGRRTFGPRIRLDDPSHPAASAVRECREVLADDGSFAGLEGGPDQRRQRCSILSSPDPATRRDGRPERAGKRFRRQADPDRQDLVCLDRRRADECRRLAAGPDRARRSHGGAR